MLIRAASVLVPLFGRLTVTSDLRMRLSSGTIFAANHDSLADPAVVLAALRGLGVEPVVMATAGLWRVPVLGRALAREGHIPVHRRSARAAYALDAAAEALAGGRHVLLYGEGGLPDRRDAAPGPPEAFRTGLARLAQVSGALVVPVGHAGCPADHLGLDGQAAGGRPDRPGTPSPLPRPRRRPATPPRRGPLRHGGSPHRRHGRLAHSRPRGRRTGPGTATGVGDKVCRAWR